MGFASLIIEFRPISNRIPEFHHFEEQLIVNRLILDRIVGPSNPEVLVDQVSDLSSTKETVVFLGEAILTSSNSKSGPGVPLMEREDFRSSTESTISTSLFHSIASVGHCEQVHTSVLNLIFQQANVVCVGNLSK